MTWLTRFSLKNIIAVFILVVLISALGIYAGLHFNQEALPDVSDPRIIVQTGFPGASSLQVQDQVTQPLKQALEQVEGLKNIRSQSANNFSVIDLVFEDRADVNEKKAWVEEQLNSVQLPEGTGKPEVIKASLTNFPVIYAAVTAKEDKEKEAEKLQSLVKDRIIPSLERVDGVSKVEEAGLAPKSITINLKVDKMKKEGISLQEIQQGMGSVNQSLAVGSLQINEKEQPLVVTGQFDSAEEVENFIVRSQPELRLKEIAEVVRGSDRQETISYFQGSQGSP